MSPSAVLTSITSESTAIAASFVAKLKERFGGYIRGGYFLTFMIGPIFNLAIAALIYEGGDKSLIPYTVVAMSLNAFVFINIFGSGEILDRERRGGTLVSLFLTPCSRLSWLAGYRFSGLAETITTTLISLIAGSLIFKVHYDVNVPALALTLFLFVVALWGIAMIQDAAGLLIKNANQLSNLIFPFFVLLGGGYFPVDKLPDWLRIPSRMLPIGYGMDAATKASLNHAPISSLGASLLPLAGFALVLPIIGAAGFRGIEILVRRRGELDIY